MEVKVSKMQSDKLISVIIPVYNVGQYLDRCMESVVNQTYKRLEIILVNDRSTDRSGELCQKWAKRDDRIIYIERETNGGVSAARNEGMRAASGDYISFVDPDDWLDLDLFEYLKNIIEENAAQMSAIQCYFVNGKKLAERAQEKEKIICMDPERAEREVFLPDGILTNGACTKLIERGIATKFLFHEKIYIGEDWLYIWQIFRECTAIVASNQKKYYYFQNSGSAVHSEFSYKYYTGLMVDDYIRTHCYYSRNKRLAELTYASTLCTYIPLAVHIKDRKQRMYWFHKLCLLAEQNKEAILSVQKKPQRIRGRLLLFHKYIYYVSERLYWMCREHDIQNLFGSGLRKFGR